MRTTLDIDSSVLQQLKEYRRRTGGSLGTLASELLATALATADRPRSDEPLNWASHPMSARIDLEDHDAVERLSNTEYRSAS